MEIVLTSSLRCELSLAVPYTSFTTSKENFILQQKKSTLRFNTTYAELTSDNLPCYITLREGGKEDVNETVQGRIHRKTDH